MNKHLWRIIALLMILAMAVSACAPAPTPTAAPTQPPAAPPTTAPVKSTAIDCKGAKSGDTISMLYQWSGVEEASLNTILKPLADACGIVL